MLYCCKDEHHKRREIFQGRFFVCFSDFASSFLKYKFFKLGVRKLHFLKCKKFFLRWAFFIFQAWNVTSLNKRKLYFLKYKKFCFPCKLYLRRYKKFFVVDFFIFYFFGLGLKVH